MKSTEENRWEVLDKKQCCHECTAPWRVRGHEQSLSFSSLPRMRRTVHDIIYVPAAPWVHEYHLTAADICIAQLHASARSSLLALTHVSWSPSPQLPSL